MVATATVLPVGKCSKGEQIFPLFACFAWNPFSPQNLRKCSALKQLLFQMRVSPDLHTCLLPNFRQKKSPPDMGSVGKHIYLILASDCWWSKSSRN